MPYNFGNLCLNEIDFKSILRLNLLNIIMYYILLYETLGPAFKKFSIIMILRDDPVELKFKIIKMFLVEFFSKNKAFLRLMLNDWLCRVIWTSYIRAAFG